MLHSPLVEIISMTHTRAGNWLSECGKNAHSKVSVCPPNPAYGCFFCFSPSPSFSLFDSRPILKSTPSLQSYQSNPPSYTHPTKHLFLVKVPLTVPTNPLSHCSFPSVSWDSTFYFFPANIFTPPPCAPHSCSSQSVSWWEVLGKTNYSLGSEQWDRLQ